MHQFDYKDTPKQLLTPSIVSQIAALHEYKGKQELYISAKADTLSAPTTYCNYIVIFTLSEERKLEDVSRIQTISSQKQTKRERSISGSSLSLLSQLQKQ